MYKRQILFCGHGESGGRALRHRPTGVPGKAAYAGPVWPDSDVYKRQVWQLLDGVKESEMKNDGYMDLFYEVLGEKYHPGYPFSCFMYYGQYDVPVKGTDKEWMEGSEEVYTYLLCVISPLTGEYEPGVPEFGFLYPAFKDRSTGWELSLIHIFFYCSASILSIGSGGKT